MISSLVSWTRNFLQATKASISSIVQWCRNVWSGIRHRHLERAGEDPGYSRALASGATALISVLTASPALAAALGVWVGEHLRPSFGRSPGRSGPSRLWDEDWDEEPDVLDSPRTWTYRR